MSTLKYRPDIDGLRALAVISVVLYHVFPDLIQSGFIGVDIFFVISGFLISSIIFLGLENNTFSLGQFYLRRIRRILPSLLTVTIVSLIFGWFILLPNELQQLGKHIASAAVFIVNFVLAGESSYFDHPENKPMLHLWSLSVEEQFYFFWPLLLIFVWHRKFNFLNITILIAIISFATNIYLINHEQSTQAFYWPMSRFWELMAGGILAYLDLHQLKFNNRYKNIQSLIGFLLLLLGFWLIKSDTQFPSWWAIFPVGGTTFIISAGYQSWLNQKLLSNKLMVWIGLISYPLYLWHFPILYFGSLYILSFEKLPFDYHTKTIQIINIIVSIILAYLTYVLIEKPIRFSKNKKTPFILLFTLVITGFLGFSCVVNKGYPNLGFRNKEKSDFANYVDVKSYVLRENFHVKYRTQCSFIDIDQHRTKKTIPNECYQRDPKFDKSLMIWGDSFAQMLYYGIQKNLPKNWQILQVASEACLPELLSSDNNIKNSYCANSNWFAFKTIKNTHPDVVLIAQRAGQNVRKMYEIDAKLHQLGVGRVIFAGPSPIWIRNLPEIILRGLWNNTPERTNIALSKREFKVNQTLKLEFKPTPVRQYISIYDYFCNSSGCLTRIGSDRKLGITTFDNGHLTPIASDALARDVLVPTILGKQEKLH